MFHIGAGKGDNSPERCIEASGTVDGILAPDYVVFEPGQILRVVARQLKDSTSYEIRFEVRALLSSKTEIDYLKCGGVLQYVLRWLCKKSIIEKPPLKEAA